MATSYEMDKNPILVRPLLLGEAPGPSAPEHFVPLDGRGGDRLAQCAGMDRAELLDGFATANLLARWPGPAGKGSAWDAATARYAARAFELPEVTVLLGRRVCGAFAAAHTWLRGPAMAWGEWRFGPDDIAVTVVPHPSGINRLYNDPAVREQVGVALREALTRPRRRSSSRQPQSASR